MLSFMADEVIYFVSDTHLGDGTGADRFRFPRELMALLNRIQSEPNAQLVLLGDFLELWATSLEPVMVHYAPVLERVAALADTLPVTYVVGNHDCLPWYYFLGRHLGNIRLVERFTAARGALVALHGHQFDPFNRVTMQHDHVKVPWTRRMVQLVGLLGRVGGEATSDAIYNLGDVLEKAADGLEQYLPDWDEAARLAMKGMLRQAKDVLEHESPGERGYPIGEKAYEDGARAIMRAGARFVVMGHTHHPLTRTYGRRVYVNTGSWVSEKYPPTYGRFAGGRLELLHGETHQPYQPPA